MAMYLHKNEQKRKAPNNRRHVVGNKKQSGLHRCPDINKGAKRLSTGPPPCKELARGKKSIILPFYESCPTFIGKPFPILRKTISILRQTIPILEKTISILISHKLRQCQSDIKKHHQSHDTLRRDAFWKSTYFFKTFSPKSIPTAKTTSCKTYFSYVINRTDVIPYISHEKQSPLLSDCLQATGKIRKRRRRA